MLVVGDLEDVFLPKPSDLLVNLAEAKTAIESLLGRLSDMFKDTHNVGNALGAALQAAFKLVVRPRLCSRTILTRRSHTSVERYLYSVPRCPMSALARSRTARTPNCSARQRSRRSCKRQRASTRILRSSAPARRFLWTCGSLARRTRMSQR